MEEKNGRTFRIVTICALCVAVLCLSVAYAALSQKLTIRANAEVQAANWDIHFGDKSTTTEGGGKIAVSSFENTSIQGLTVTLTKPGDSATLKFKIYNDGDVNATLATLTEETTTNGLGKLKCTSAQTEPGQKAKDEQLVCGNVTYEFKYDKTGDGPSGDDTAVSQGDELNSGDSKDVYIKITLPRTTPDLPSDEVTITGLNRTLIYNQKITPDA